MPRADAALLSLFALIAARRVHAFRPPGREFPSRGRRPPSRLGLAKQRTTNQKSRRTKKRKRDLASLLEVEADLRRRGYAYVIGSDDAGGAGCVAGPVVVASCCLLRDPASFLPIASRDGTPPSSEASSEGSIVSPSEVDALSEVDDCKSLTPERRRAIRDVALSRPDLFATTVARRSPKQIDDANLDRATREAFAESIEALVGAHDLPFDEVYAIVDGRAVPKLYASERKQCDAPEDVERMKLFPVRPYVDGDANVYAVALASIIARVARDEMMKELDEQYPMYGFADHFGYGRRDHIEKIHRLGSLEGVHRMSFKQVKGR